MVALDKTTGKTVWKTDRSTKFGDIDGDFRKAFCTPIVIGSGPQRQLVSPGSKAAMAYDLHTGRELWKIHFDGFSSTARPLAADGLVFLFTGFGKSALWAVRPDGQGDVTESHVLWNAEDGLPDTCSPLVTSQCLLLLSSEGILTSYDVKSGKKLWEQDFESSFKASPSLVGKNVYLLGDEGKAWIVEPGPAACKTVAQADVGEHCTASPAFQDGRIYLRGKEHLFCIGNK